MIQFDILRIHLERSATAITILLEIEADIDTIAILYILRFISLPKCNTIHRQNAVCQIQVQMLTVTHRTCIAVINEVST